MKQCVQKKVAFKDDVSDSIIHVKVFLSHMEIETQRVTLASHAAFPDRVGCLFSLLFAFGGSFHTLISAKSLKPKFSAKYGTFSNQKTLLKSSSSGFVKLAPLPFLMSTC